MVVVDVVSVSLGVETASDFFFTKLIDHNHQIPYNKSEKFTAWR